tara:strand:+ start:196 stop:756 length:561 start_codon:yes stop_codon:yes gene_type:complete
MKKYIFVFSIFILFYSCNISKKSGKQNNTERELGVFVTCSGPDFLTSKKYFRANSIGESIDQVVSKRKALNNARANLAASLKILLASVIDNYIKFSNFNNLDKVMERFEGLNREVIKQELVGIKTICENLTKTTEGKFKTYIAIELSMQKLFDKFHERMMKDDLLMINYDYEKFKDTFEKEMGKLN